METNQIPPSQRKQIGGLGKVNPASLVDDLQWELQNLCAARNLIFNSTVEGCEIETTNNQVFNSALLDKFKCETQSFTEHYLFVNAESDAGNYSASRFMKNLRNAIKLLQSSELITVPCDEKNCDYCQ
jgi:hypothetical protein